MINERDVFFQKLFVLLAEKFCLKDNWKVTYDNIDMDIGIAANCNRSWEYNTFHINISSSIYYESSYESCIEYIVHEFCHGINGGIERLNENDSKGLDKATRYVTEKTTKHWEKILLLLLDKDLDSLLKAHKKSLKEKVNGK